MASSPTQTIAITNFSGPLTRQVNGDLNSGMAKFATSWGYDPFSQPGNLTWNYQASDIKGSVITDAVVAGTFNFLNNFTFFGNSGRLYNVNPTGLTDNSPLADTSSFLGSLPASDFIYGSDIIAGLTKISNAQSVLGTSDTKLFKISTDGSAGSVIGTFANTSYGIGPHPMVQFLGKTYAGDGNQLWEVTGLVVTNTAVLNPPLPLNLRITDVDLTPEGDYMVITATRTGVMPLDRSTGTIRPNNAGESYLFYWNGTDAGVTAVKTLPSWPTSAFQNFLDKQYITQQDAFGMALYEGNTKLLTLPSNVFPASNALTSNGNFLTWTSNETTGTVNNSTQPSSTYTSLYYFGRLDEQNPSGLFRMLRISPTSGAAYSSPYNGMINDFYQQASIVSGWGKHYITTQELNSSGTSAATHFYSFALNPAQSGLPVLGVYETQTQLFSKRISVSQIRVYCDPTATGNSFKLDIIGSNGNPVPNGTYTYTYGDITDPQSGSQAVERVNFNSDCKTQYSLGVRITNLGTTNMVIRKVELDIDQEGK